MLTLAEFTSGETGRVLNLTYRNLIYRQKLLAMGLTPGTHFLVKRVAPLGDPVEIVLRGYSLSLRKKEADILQVERVLA